MRAPRLAWPLAISLALHLCLAWLFAAGNTEQSPRSSKAVTLTVTLASKERAEPPPIAAAPPTAAPETTVGHADAATSDATGNLTQKARFLVPPDLAALEEIPVPVSGSLTLRLEVSALGTVDRVTVIKSDPVPKELLDGVIDRFQHAKLSPARAGSRAVASTLDLVIRYETAPAMLPRRP